MDDEAIDRISNELSDQLREVYNQEVKEHMKTLQEFLQYGSDDEYELSVDDRLHIAAEQLRAHSERFTTALLKSVLCDFYSNH